MKKKYLLTDINSLEVPINKPCIIFLKWDLGAGKTTLSKYIIQKILWKDEEVISPTYTYYNRYDDIYHFDLYRLKDYDEFFAIGWEDILDNNEWVVLVEWPELIQTYYEADIEIYLSKTDNPDEREIDIKIKTK